MKFSKVFFGLVIIFSLISCRDSYIPGLSDFVDSDNGDDNTAGSSQYTLPNINVFRNGMQDYLGDPQYEDYNPSIIITAYSTNTVGLVVKISDSTGGTAPTKDEVETEAERLLKDNTENLEFPGVLPVTVRVYELGDTGPAGGIIFYIKNDYLDNWKYLEAAPATGSTQIINLRWWRDRLPSETTAEYGALSFVSGTSAAIGTGKRNTELIITSPNYVGVSGRAAQRAAAVNFGGKTDWFLPSEGELMEMYQNRALIGASGFANAYWSSTQGTASSNGSARALNFGNGNLSSYTKDSPSRIRVIRSF